MDTLYNQIIELDNINKAIKKVRRAYRSLEANPLHIQQVLMDVYNYQPRPYREKPITNCGKKRNIYIAKLYPDKVIHHAIMNILAPILINEFIPNTYQCIPTRGTHGAVRNMTEIVQSHTQLYYSKVDIVKYYDNVDRDILKSKLSMFIPFEFKLLELLYRVISWAPGDKGLPIGNYSSQILANFYLTELDHKIYNTPNLYYFRYADDMVLISEYPKVVKSTLASLLSGLTSLNLNYHTPIFGKVSDNGIDFLGFNINHNQVRLRQANKIKLKRLKKLGYKGYITKHEHNRIMATLGYSKGLLTDESLYKYVLNYKKSNQSPSLHQLLKSL